MAETVTSEISKLLDQGKTSGEIIGMGYKKGAVYAVQRKWRRREVKASPVGTGKENIPAPAIPSTTVAPLSTAEEIESDPEILQLRKEIRKAELERQLDRVKTPPEVVSVIAIALDHGTKKRNKCGHLREEVCQFHRWSSRDEIPQAAGEPLWIEKPAQHWHIKPSALFCALCPTNYELDEVSDRLIEVEIQVCTNPLSGIRADFKCDCGAAELIVVPVRCGKCGRETLWGWSSA